MEFSSRTFRFLLFVSKGQPQSSAAAENLFRLLKEHIPGDHHVEVMDVKEDLPAVIEHKVVVAPTLVVEDPVRKVKLIGPLDDPTPLLSILEKADTSG